MAAFDEDFDANTVKPNEGFAPLPVGTYQVVITDSEEKPNKKGTGTYHQFTIQVIEGEYEGRRVWARLNLNNPNQQAVDIARGDLSAICRAVKVMKPKDSADLHNLPFLIELGMEKNKETGELSNKIKKYMPLDGATAAKAPTPAAPSTPPWKRQKAATA